MYLINTRKVNSILAANNLSLNRLSKHLTWMANIVSMAYTQKTWKEKPYTTAYLSLVIRNRVKPSDIIIKLLPRALMVNHDDIILAAGLTDDREFFGDFVYMCGHNYLYGDYEKMLDRFFTNEYNPLDLTQNNGGCYDENNPDNSKNN